MNFSESDASRVHFDVGSHKQTTLKSLVLLAVGVWCCSPVVCLIVYADVLPVHVFVDLCHVPDAIFIVLVAVRGGCRRRGDGGGGSVRWNADVQQWLAANDSKTCQREVRYMIADDQHVTVHLYQAYRSLMQFRSSSKSTSKYNVTETESFNRLNYQYWKKSKTIGSKLILSSMLYTVRMRNTRCSAHSAHFEPMMIRP